jgi:HTH-type transcriptional regulator/antitoxin HigA
MNIRPIKTEKDYKLALKEIEGLMDTAPGTPNGDRLDVLSTLVAAWEEKYHTIEAPDVLIQGGAS